MMVFFPVDWSPSDCEAVSERYRPGTSWSLPRAPEPGTPNPLLSLICLSVSGRLPTAAEVAINTLDTGERLFALLGRAWGDDELEAFLCPFIEASIVYRGPEARWPPEKRNTPANGFLWCGRFGFDVFFNREATLQSVFLYGEGYAAFSGALPRGISFAEPRSAVIARLGAPSESAYGDEPAWDRWDFGENTLQCHYSLEPGRLGLVTLTRSPLVDCSFSGMPRRRTPFLFTGREVSICDQCLDLASEILADAARPVQRAVCSFCGEMRASTASPPINLAICEGCLEGFRSVRDRVRF